MLPIAEDRATAIGNMHEKFGEDRTCSSEDINADRQTHTHTHTHTHRHAHYNTPLPYRCNKTAVVHGSLYKLCS